MDANVVYDVKRYIEKNNLAHLDNEKSKMQLRSEGKIFSLQEHVKGIIYSLLSAQTVWANIEKNMPMIDMLFFDYDIKKIKQYDYTYYVDGLAKLRCRSRLTNAQMKQLHNNIDTIEKIVADYGSMDKFVTSAPQDEIVAMLSDSSSKYKLKQMGPALAWEYLRNVGVDGAKPDVHMKRILGSNRLAYSKYINATDKEVLAFCEEMSDKTGLWMAEIDYLFWLFCATDKAEICTATPACHKCVLQSKCNKNANSQ